ncbi:MAG: hypothetical protein JWO05_1486 [Gemmatimonadetes bacterium]|nr:hypothetical protein [Gemmatimonadota bacterium]
MAHRSFQDAKGVEWQAWDVQPQSAERRRHDRRTGSRRAPDRRHVASPRSKIDSEFAKGWLAFQCEGEKRRLVPIPAGWHALPDEAMLELLSRAAVTRSSGAGRRQPSPPDGA